METNTTKPSFLLGEEWLYYKIYTGFATTDMILQNYLRPLILRLLQQGIIDKWFFIRYADPEHHLRLRVHLTQTENIGTVILAFRETFRRLSDQHIVWKIQTETYERELNRYGDQLIEQAETLFFYDSECTVLLLNVLDSNENDTEKWMAGMASIDTFLEAFGYDLEQKKALMERLRTAFFNEFGVNAATKKELSTKYRNHKTEMERFMKSDAGSNTLIAVLQERNKCLAEPVRVILKHWKSDPVRINDVLGSYIHMMMNRLFDSNNRQCEMVLYDLLCSYYTSVLARKKKEPLTVSD